MKHETWGCLWMYTSDSRKLFLLMMWPNGEKYISYYHVNAYWYQVTLDDPNEFILFYVNDEYLHDCFILYAIFYMSFSRIKNYSTLLNVKSLANTRNTANHICLGKPNISCITYCRQIDTQTRKRKLCKYT